MRQGDTTDLAVLPQRERESNAMKANARRGVLRQYVDLQIRISHDTVGFSPLSPNQ
jgi:hypothetical protein